MLMSLLGRGKSRADEAVPEALKNAPASRVTKAEQQAQSSQDPIKPVRRSKGSRASDIIDEEGRSAEEIAAEAAQEFDISGVVAKAATLPDRPDGPVKRPSSASEPKRKGSEGDAPQVVVLPDSLVTPQSAPADKAPDLGDGHIAFPKANVAAQRATYAARDLYWSNLGETDPELLQVPVPSDSPMAANWPDADPTFRLVRTENSLIIATEGLSDPFRPGRGAEDANGFGLELFIEVIGWQTLSLDRVEASWALSALTHVAQIAAKMGCLAAALEKHGRMTVELPRSAAPKKWREAGASIHPGAVLGMPVPPGRNQIGGMPLSPVRAIAVTLIFPEELDDCLQGGSAARATLADDLMTTGQGHFSNPQRFSLR